MANSKIVYFGQTLMDISGDTVTPGTLARGATAHDKSGAAITGTMSPGTDTSDATAAAGDILAPKTAYVAGGKVTGTIPTQAGETVTPGTAQQTVVPAGTYVSGDVKVEGSPSLVDSNIKKNVTIFGVTGTLDAGSDTSDATATAGDILEGTTAYIASGKVDGTMPAKSASDVTVSGADVNVPAGYYGTAVTKSVAAGSASIPATAVTANPTISVNSATGEITASISASESVTPSVTAGYVSAGTPGTLNVSGGATEQLPTQAAATITPSSSQQTAVAAGKYTTGAVVVAPIPYVETDNAAGGKTVSIG